MKPFEDSIPEEQEGKQERLTTLLRRAYSQEQTLPEREQQEAMLRVEERLTGREERAVSLTEQTPERAAGSFLLKLQSRSGHQRSVMRVMSALAAVLVVGLLIGSAALLFAQRAHSPAGQTTTPGQARPTSEPSSVDVKWSGLEMSMKITPGPYFLGESVAVDLSLTNHSHLTLRLAGKGGNPEVLPDYPCGYYSLFPEQTGGTSPHYSLYTEPVGLIYSCPAMHIPGPDQGTALAPGKTVADHFYMLLTGSGDVTLTGGAYLYVPGMGLQEYMHPLTQPPRNFGPLTAHLPTLRIYVAPQVPTDRMLSFQQKGSEVLIHAPAGTQFVEQTYILCKVSSADRGTPDGDFVSIYSWQTLSTHTLQRPACPDISGWSNGQRVTNSWTIVLWKYAIGAVGYEVAQGQSTLNCHPC